jgi:hypothetical protein
MVRAAALSLALLLTASLPAASQHREMSVLGSGSNSCASWITGDVAGDYQAVGWILGYWSGANSFSETPSNGFSVDVVGIVERVRMECQQRPDWALLHVANLVYKEYQREGR